MTKYLIVITTKRNFPTDVKIFESIDAAENYVRIEKERMTELEGFVISHSNSSGFLGSIDGDNVSVIATYPNTYREER